MNFTSNSLCFSIILEITFIKVQFLLLVSDFIYTLLTTRSRY